ncbi:hypothetical protein FJZ31_21440 [Candidatus Poribacteria bacterium]|nr:hypothetical protein [Candidatus Poribacteria bacterium]
MFQISVLAIEMVTEVVVSSIAQSQANASAKKTPPTIKKLGTIDCDMVETTPIVFHNQLYRFEYVRANYKLNKTGNSYFRFIDVESGKPIPAFATGYHLGSAYAEDDMVYAYGVNTWGAENIQVFWSKDLKEWSSRPALTLPGWGIYNTSVCKGPERYIMAVEIGKPPEETGVGFTMRFAESSDLLNWKLTASDCVYSKEKYTACPALRFLPSWEGAGGRVLDGFYYMVYLEARPGPTYETHIVRSQDLVHWESSPFNPMLKFSEEDKKIGNPNLTAEQRERIAKAVNRNNSDVDLCEFKGQVIIYYSWGDQQGTEFLAQSVYDGTLESFFRGFFPED